jgi:Tfp pilus assembly protein PilO
MGFLQNLGLRQSPVRSKLWLFLVILAAANAILLFLVFRPVGRSLSERQEELKRSRATYEASLARVRQMRELRTKLTSAIQNDQEFSKKHFLTRGTAFSSMLSDLEKLGSENHVKTASIGYQIKTQREQPEFANVAVTMTVEGAYPELMQFINKLERSDMFWIIDNMNVAASQARPLRLNLLMETYAVL